MVCVITEHEFIIQILSLYYPVGLLLNKILKNLEYLMFPPTLLDSLVTEALTNPLGDADLSISAVENINVLFFSRNTRRWFTNVKGHLTSNYI